MDRRFKIDFIELAFLVETCVPPGPIARSMFWDDVINVYYHEMTPHERVRLFNWIHKSWVYNKGLEKGLEEIEVFEARFDPNNQYIVFTNYKDKEESCTCFKYKDKNSFGQTLFILLFSFF
jgi:hypothetical protein